MTKVTNTWTTALTLPNGQTLQPHDATEVRDWNILENHDVVKAWIAAEVLVPGSKSTEKLVEPAKRTNDGTPKAGVPASNPGQQPLNPAIAGLDLEALDLKGLQALAAERGVSYGKQWGAGRLRTLLATPAASGDVPGVSTDAPAADAGTDDAGNTP